MKKIIRLVVIVVLSFYSPCFSIPTGGMRLPPVRSERLPSPPPRLMAPRIDSVRPLPLKPPLSSTPTSSRFMGSSIDRPESQKYSAPSFYQTLKNILVKLKNSLFERKNIPLQPQQKKALLSSLKRTSDLRATMQHPQTWTAFAGQRRMFSTTHATAGGSSWAPSEEFLKHISWKEVSSKLNLSHSEVEYVTKLARQQLIPREKEHCSDHVVFYHGQYRWFLIFYKFQKALLAMLQKKSVTNFEFLRNLENLHENNDIVQSFLKQHEFKINDHKKNIRNALLAVNLSFPGNLEPGESSLQIYAENFVIDPFDIKKFFTEMIMSSLKYLNFSSSLFSKQEFIIEKSINDLTLLAKNIMNYTTTPYDNYGTLLQIFIPNNEVENYAYLCRAFGEPLKNNDWLLNSKKIKELFADSPSASSLEHLQARLLLNKTLFASPESGVKIFSYTSLPDSEIKKYKEQIEEIVNDLVDALFHESNITTA